VHRDPLRLVITGNARQPIRSLVIPRGAPAALVGLAALVVIATVLLAVDAWRARGAIDQLKTRIEAMTMAAEGLWRRHPASPTPGAPVPVIGTSGGVPLARLPTGGKGRFVVHNVNTGKKVEVEIDSATGETDPRSYRALRHLMQCRRTSAEHPIDPRLLDLLYRMAAYTQQKEILLVSGFRASQYSTAAFSYHARGMAADIRIPGMTPARVRDLAQSLGARGIGYYPSSGFVHIDVREERFSWTESRTHQADQSEPLTTIDLNTISE
jgi:uncharacterized protein YcbK (DUF882 family)